MKSIFLKLFNKKIDIKRFHYDFFDQNRYWFFSLIIFTIVILSTAFVGAMIFRYIYLEKYKNDTENSSDIYVEMRINALKRIIEKREDFVISDTKTPKDPSL